MSSLAPEPASPVTTVSPGGGIAVRIEQVHKTFPGGVAAVEGVDLDIAPGAFVALVGPSGCGKSTLLRIVAGLDSATRGRVVLSPSPEQAHASRAPIAYVFQDAHLLPWRSVLDNAALPLELSGMDRTERRTRAHEMLAHVGLGDFTTRYPAELSGGMRMRVSLARALVTRPRLLLLDEPFGALDELTRGRLDEQLRVLWQELGMTVLFVTHSLSEAAWLAERVIVFSPRPARVVLDRTPELPRQRTAALRVEAAFAREVQILSEALERGGA
ncbi:ABC transporter ATP-binding protein [Hyalangium minutum]|uniref:ABC-type nitrate/sulfonate/bicarbonate transport system, ATPase component n=1 Tax=Hyalangium minutum TaxID=394096 RepID=A0A085WPK4_9BACT|nr:ABC transporter ATP-binding protein [Hyalangium minutum]KFE69617.1 ABC-type nitrate/sulfonate/bicarbonate transport system, ATPase component [Hyalangium minutum]